jgi:hypothetical protein
MTTSPTDPTCYDCATNQTRLDTLDDEYVTICLAVDVLRKRMCKLVERCDGQADQINRLVGFAASDQAHKDLARRVETLEYTVRNLQRLAQSVHGPEAGL